ncbi:MAG: hypothetical protein SFU91_06680 [Chloroherpetonaceae bacterium]|nr:hypothetical protein [Chloroherpetonaceae bacterium]
MNKGDTTIYPDLVFHKLEKGSHQYLNYFNISSEVNQEIINFDTSLSSSISYFNHNKEIFFSNGSIFYLFENFSKNLFIFLATPIFMSLGVAFGLLFSPFIIQKAIFDPPEVIYFDVRDEVTNQSLNSTLIYCVPNHFISQVFEDSLGLRKRLKEPKLEYIKIDSNTIKLIQTSLPNTPTALTALGNALIPFAQTKFIHDFDYRYYSERLKLSNQSDTDVESINSIKKRFKSRDTSFTSIYPFGITKKDFLNLLNINLTLEESRKVNFDSIGFYFIFHREGYIPQYLYIDYQKFKETLFKIKLKRREVSVSDNNLNFFNEFLRINYFLHEVWNIKKKFPKKFKLIPLDTYLTYSKLSEIDASIEIIEKLIPQEPVVEIYKFIKYQFLGETTSDKSSSRYLTDKDFFLFKYDYILFNEELY